MYTEITNCSVPIYVGKDTRFLMDALDLGLIVRKIDEHFFACDDYPDAAETMYRYGRMWLNGVQFKHETHKGPIPSVRTFQIPLCERTFGSINVQAENLREAYKKIPQDILLDKVSPMSLQIDPSRQVNVQHESED